MADAAAQLSPLAAAAAVSAGADAAAAPQAPSPDGRSPLAALLDVAAVGGALKRTPRTGWVRHGVRRPESVADHCHRVALLALLLPHPDPSYDRARAALLGLVHDLPEALTGDLTPDEVVAIGGRGEKLRREGEAVRAICGLAGAGGAGAAALSALIHEAEVCESVEARAVKDLDVVEMMVQAGEYEDVDADAGADADGRAHVAAQPARAGDLDLSPFFAAARGGGRWRSPVGGALAAEVLARREAARAARRAQQGGGRAWATAGPRWGLDASHAVVAGVALAAGAAIALAAASAARRL